METLRGRVVRAWTGLLAALRGPSAAEGTMTAAAFQLQMAAESSASTIAEARQEADRILSRARGEASTLLCTARRHAEQDTTDAQDCAAQLQRSVQERRDVASRPLTERRDELQRPITIAEVVGADPGPLIGKHDQIHWVPAPVSPPSLDEPPGQPRTAWHHQPAFMLTFGVVAIMLTISSVGYRLMQEPQTGPGRAAVTADSHASPLHIAGEYAGGPDAEWAAAGSGPSAPAPAPTPVRPPDPGERPGRAHSIAPVNAVAFGPHGPGQGDDPHGAWLAIDGQRRTAWHTRRYTTARFGSLYPGTGLLLDMGNTVTITAARVTLGAATGASFQIRIGNQPMLADLRPAADRGGCGISGPGALGRLGHRRCGASVPARPAVSRPGGPSAMRRRRVGPGSRRRRWRRKKTLWPRWPTSAIGRWPIRGPGPG